MRLCFEKDPAVLSLFTAVPHVIAASTSRSSSEHSLRMSLLQKRGKTLRPSSRAGKRKAGCLVKHAAPVLDGSSRKG